MSCGFLAQKAKLIYATRRFWHHTPQLRYVRVWRCCVYIGILEYLFIFKFLKGRAGVHECKWGKHERKPAIV